MNKNRFRLIAREICGVKSCIHSWDFSPRSRLFICNNCNSKIDYKSVINNNWNVPLVEILDKIVMNEQ